jgi:hypothetical protein
MKLRLDRNTKASYLQDSIFLIRLQKSGMLTSSQLHFPKFTWYDQDKKSRRDRRYRTDEKFQLFSISLNEWKARINLAICALEDKIFEQMRLGSKSTRVLWNAA